MNHWRNNEEMAVWEPVEKTTVFRQIKKLIMLKIELAERKINKQKQIKTNEGFILEFIV